MATKLPTDTTTPAAALSYAHSGGQVDDEYLSELRGTRGRRTLRQMGDNATIAGLLSALHALFRTTEWHVDPAQAVEDIDTAAEQAGWAYRAITEMGDPTHPLGGSWDSFLYICATALENGWAYTDICRKLQDDGTIGIGQVTHVHPETLDRWDGEGRVVGLWQYPPNGGISRYIPLERAVLFVPEPWKGSPEGRSILRPAYSDWFYRERLVSFRAILAERMSGFPVVTANSDIKKMATDATLSDQQRNEAGAVVKSIEAIAPNIKVNKQAGVTLWTKPYQNVDAEGNLSYASEMQLKLELLSPSGSNMVDYDRAIQDHEMNIARAALATWLMMGSTGTSGAENGVATQRDAFIQAAKANLNALATCLSRQLVPMLWKWNGFDERYMPTVRAGRIDTASLESLGRYIESLTRSGVVLNDPETEEHLRREGGLPIPETLDVR